MRTAALMVTAVFSFTPLFSPAAFGQQADPLAACGAPSINFSVERGPLGDSKVPAADKARVYIVAIQNQRGPFSHPTIRQAIDGSWIGATRGFTYVSADVTPGVHHLCSIWQSDSASLTDRTSLGSIDAVAGKQYYFRIQIVLPGGTEGSGVASIDLQPVSEDEGRFLVSQAALSISKQKN